MNEKTEKLINELQDLSDRIGGFRNTISTNSIWNMNDGVNIPEGIDGNSLEWKKFYNRYTRTMSSIKKNGILTIENAINQGNIIAVKDLIQSEDLDNLEFLIDDIILNLRDLTNNMDNDTNSTEQENLQLKNKKIFISHSSDDVKYVQAICELLEVVGLGKEDIFCSSIPGYGIPVGNNIYDYLRNEFISNDLIVIFVLSDNYYKSVPCMNEMGAAWILKNKHYSFLVPSFEFHNVKGAIDPRDIAIKLDDTSLSFALNGFREELEKSFLIQDIDLNRWERYRTKFIESIN
jgi:hypothetical protein